MRTLDRMADWLMDHPRVSVSVFVALVLGLIIAVVYYDQKAQEECEAKGGRVVRPESKCYFTTSCHTSNNHTTCTTRRACPWECEMPQ